ncbi:[FeFe] hydrogenase H-cluster radical SAM maturase HydE [Caproicibacterium lactatifermentans]|uniref:[FeFe] hydrogenase H-cluster radical SAM maturase HydE n=1 Tax=Caproicibacterium lactatifermentans TaxID=2666138 RepID=A0ABX6PWS8_9FIRM|nr:[FeFe] hydrogenase H-cluster radical SAM maturase HydE [Caproicibacterium lactatifermentans]QKO30577.1 [FeFe] hydrogenase H-cluster radical SAM maturase HydE [Caproicibacterium lactatifermentans]
MTNRERIDNLNQKKALPRTAWVTLLSTFTAEDQEYARTLAQTLAVQKFGKQIFYRGIIEFTNICKNDCIYCGIRRSNTAVSRYRLTKEDILACCAAGYEYGYRTFVLQGGEDVYFNDDRMTDIVSSIHSAYPDCAITLSLGERSRESYQKLFDAGADRYLLRHETANKAHYGKLHPAQMSFDHRMQCLRELKEIGYQTGCGMMIGSPYQTAEDLAEDMAFLYDFQPEMVGMGPFIPHKDTPFRDYPAGRLDLCLFLLSLTRLTLPDVLLPATTALGTIHPQGRELGILSGANVIMPNLSPTSVRKQYMLYNNKICTDEGSGQCRFCLGRRFSSIGYQTVVSRGDYQKQ